MSDNIINLESYSSMHLLRSVKLPLLNAMELTLEAHKCLEKLCNHLSQLNKATDKLLAYPLDLNKGKTSDDI